VEWAQVAEYSLYASLALALAVPPAALALGRTRKAIAALGWLSLLAFTVAALATLAAAGQGRLELYNGLVVHDGFTSLILLAAAASAAIAMAAAGREPLLWESSPAYYSLLPMALFGSYYIVGAADALLVLAAWLLVSVISYVIVALPPEKETRAAAVRYVLVGAVATLFLALWVAASAIVAGENGRLSFALTSLGAGKASALAFAAVLAALGFKLGVVPFHWWLPSVYGRGNGLVIAAVSGVIKLAFIGLFARIIAYAASVNVVAATSMAAALAVLAVATMTYGNVAALTAGDLKRVLAYSSVAHVGYILAGAAALAYYTPLDPRVSSLALAGIAVQALAYGAAKAALFPLAEEVPQAKGLASASRAAAVSAAVLLMSLLGMPPLLGFWGKLYLFLAAASYSLLLVAAALVNSAISSVYYVRIAREALSHGDAPKPSPHVTAALIVAAAAAIILGLAAPQATALVPPP